MNAFISCLICKKKLTGIKRKFCSIKCKNQFHQSYPAQKKRGLMRKLELFKIAGGKCKACGYKKNLASLSFHHLNSKEKDFKLDARSLSNRTLAVVKQEFAKCILVCHNCHHEIHNPSLDLTSESLSRLL